MLDDSHVKKKRGYLDCGTVAKRAYIWFGYINRGRELREREVLNSAMLFF